MMRFIVVALVALFIAPSAAQAAPLAAAVSSLVAAVGSFASTTIGAFVLRAAAYVALTALQRARQKKGRLTGLKTEVTATGDTTPQSFLIGRYATGGAAVCPPMSQGYYGGYPNAYLTYVIDLGDLPSGALDEVYISGEKVELDGDEHPDYGRGATGTFAGRLWVKYYDGTQTEADPMLLDKFGDVEERPWTADMVGVGVPYVIATVLRDPKVFSGWPSWRFVAHGIGFYDPRKDSSIGGVGSHRWGDRTTYEYSDNPVLIGYNILRGIALPDGAIWGGDAEFDEVPLDVWVAGMNACDPEADGGGSTVEGGLRVGYEVSLDQEPMEVFDKIMRAASAEYVEVGGTWYVRVGPPALPSYFLTDDDVIRTEDREMDPFPGLKETFNGIHATYPEPSENWEMKDAPGVYDPEFEAADGGRRLLTDLQFEAVPYPDQVQFLMHAWQRDGRRFLQHQLPLPPDAARLNPLESVAWTSARHGYSNKVFEVDLAILNGQNLTKTFVLRERDANDYVISADDIQQLNHPSTALVPAPPVAVAGFDVRPAVQVDADGDGRREGFEILWDISLAGFSGLQWRARLVGDTEHSLVGSTQNLAAGRLFVGEGVIPGQDYLVSARLSVRTLDATWTADVPVSVPFVGYGAKDLSAELNAVMEDTRERATQGRDLHYVNLTEADGALGSLRDQVFGANSVLPVEPLVDRIARTIAPLTGDVSLQDQIIEAFGPLDAGVSLSARLDIEVERLDFEIPRLRAAERSADDAFGELIRLQAQLGETRSVLARAGIVVDGENGKVVISGLSVANDRLAEVGLTLDAMSGEISTKATVAYVKDEISKAVLDPTQIPVVDDLQLRVGSVETTLTAETARINNLATLLSVDGQTMSMTSVSSRLDAAEEALTQRVTNEDFDEHGDRINDVEQVLTTLGDTSEIRESVTATRRQGRDQADQDGLMLSDLLNGIDADMVARQTDAAARRQIYSHVNERFEGEAAQRLELQVQADDTAAKLLAEQRVRAAQSEATGQILEQIQLDLQSQQDGLTGTAETLNETTARVAETEDGLSVQTKQISFQATGIRDLRALSEEEAGQSILHLWNRIEAGDQLREQITVAMRAVRSHSEEGLFAEVEARELLGVALDGAVAAIVEEGRVRAEADAVIVEDVSRLEGRIEDTEGSISQLNTVDLSSDSALVQALLVLDGQLADPDTGLEAQGQAIEALTTRQDNSEDGLTSMAAQALLLEASVGAGQLLPNGDFAEGDLRGWSEIPTTFLVRAQQSGGPAALASAPTAFVLEIAQDSVSRRARALSEYRIHGGEQLRLSLRAAATTTGDAAIVLRCAFYRADGSYLTAQEPAIFPAGHDWQEHDLGRITAPVGAHSVTIWLRRNAGGVGNVFVADLRIERVTRGQAEVSGQIAELNTVDATSKSVLVQAHRSLEGKVNDPETGLVKAHGLITELNTVDVNSESALVQAHVSLAATVNDPETGLVQAHGLITELNTVDVDSESALVQAHVSLAATVNDPETGLVKAHGLITELNTVDINSESALVQAHVSLAATVNDPETGLVKAHGLITELNTVDVNSESALVQAHVSLAATVNDPETGLVKAHGLITELNTVDVNSESALVQAHVSLAGAVNDPETGLAAQGEAIETLTSRQDDNDGALSSLVVKNELLEASIAAGQILPNGDFAEGDLRGWSDVPSTFLVRAKQAGGPAALEAAPTAYVLEIAQDGVSRRSKILTGYKIHGGEQLRLSLRAAATTTGDATIVLRCAFYRADGTYLTAQEPAIFPAGHGWQEYDLGTITAPIDAHSVTIWLRRNAGGVGNAFVADLRIERVTRGQADALARISNMEATRVDAAGAIAAVEQRVEAEFASLTAMAEATTYAKAKVDGISAGYVLRLNGENIFEFVSAGDGTDGVKVTGKIDTDYLHLTGLSQLDEALIRELAVSSAFVEEFVAKDASVDTLQIAGNAVTVPARYFIPGHVTIDTRTSWKHVISLRLDRAGFATDIHFHATIDGFGDAMADIAIFRDDVLLETNHRPCGLGGRQDSVDVQVSDYDTGTGPTVYTVKARMLDPSLTGGWNAAFRLEKRRLKLIQYKR